MRFCGLLLFLALAEARGLLPAAAIDPLFPYQWNLLNTGQRAGIVPGEDIDIQGAWTGDPQTGRPPLTGAGINVSILDNGVQLDHPDLADNIEPSAPFDPLDPARLDLDLIDNDGNAWPAQNEHGTTVAGTVAAVGLNDRGIIGIAYRAGIVPVRVFGAPSQTTDEMLHSALLHRVDENTTANPGPGLVDVANASWFIEPWVTPVPLGPRSREALEEGTGRGRNGRGIVYVFSADHGGHFVNDMSDDWLFNDGDLNLNGYASSRFTIAVGPSDGQGRPTFYHEPGSGLLVNAPSSFLRREVGEFVDWAQDFVTLYSTAPFPAFVPVPELPQPEAGLYSWFCGGASHAAAQVTGVVALMLELSPTLTWRDVQHILVRTAEQSGPPLPPSPGPPGPDFDAEGWQRTAGGHWFSHGLGFGRVNATGAVAMAHTWVNLPAATPLTASSEGAVVIPDGSASGASAEITLFNADGLRAEAIEVTITGLSHPHHGDLEIDLVSPGGTRSRLMHARPQAEVSLSGWLFTTVAHWDEDPGGPWRLEIRDRSSAVPGNGTLTGWTLTVHGHQPPPGPAGLLMN